MSKFDFSKLREQIKQSGESLKETFKGSDNQIQGYWKRDDQWLKNVKTANQIKHKDPNYKQKLIEGLNRARSQETFKHNHKKSIQEQRAIPKETIVEIFNQFHCTDRTIEDSLFKKQLSKIHNISIGHINKICMAGSSYVKECLGYSDNQIEKIKETYNSSKPKYIIRTFGVDLLDRYENYSYRSKFPVKLVWEVRFGKYKGLKRKQLEQELKMLLSRDDADSFKKSYPWLTDKLSQELYVGDFNGIRKFIKVPPTKKEKFGFVKTGKYQGCFIEIK